MGTIQKNSDWERRTSVQKGNIGEGVVQAFLESKGFVVYRPISDEAHPFDMLAVKDKRLCIGVEVKTKAMRTFYEDTGFNQSTFEDYDAFSKKHNMDIFVFFVDENKMEIYGNWLCELEKPRTLRAKNGKVIHYPFVEENKRGKEVRYYPYSAMKVIAKIDAQTAGQLKKLSRRNYEYT